MGAVRLRGIHKSFGTTRARGGAPTPVLRGVDIDVEDGGFAVLVGPSGCGKSTLLRVIAGLEEADQGSIHFGDREVTRLAPRDRDVAMVFQSYALYPHLTVRENLAFGLELRKTPREEIERRIAEAAEMLGLEKLLGRYPRELSGGQRQRVAMGRAIVRRPALFLFDEPLSNLDAALRAQVRVDIRKLHDRLGATSVYVTHDQVEAMTLADRIYVLREGRVEQSGAPLDVFGRPETVFVAAFLGSPAMNFIEADLAEESGAWWVRSEGVALPISPDLLGKNPRAQSVSLGLRPHDVGLYEKGQARIEAVVDVVEALGTESFAHCRVGKSPFIARLDGSLRPSAGERLALEVAPENVHVFDPETGRALFAKDDPR